MPADIAVSPTLVRLAPAGYRRTPWKNGGGVTVDIADSYEPGAVPGGWDGMIWRLGRTRIERPAPFSDLAGNDRILTVIGGRGLRLRAANGRMLDATEPFRPVRFPGEWPIVSELEDGPVEVLNLMADRAKARIDVTFPAVGEAFALEAGIGVLYAPAGPVEVSIDGQALSLAHDHAAVAQDTKGLALGLVSGVLALVRIQSRLGGQA